MRELKFRFWNTIARRFQPSKRYAIDADGKLLGYDFEFARYDDNPVPFSQTCIIPQQYTGLQDKHGKDIYEGDILFFQQQDGVWPNQSNKHIEVKYPFVCGNTHLGEIIGNIFENPGLLK